jgi:hypothetical protein
MPSASLRQWRAVRVGALEEIENAHRSVGGSGRGRRHATQQINQAYAVLLSSQFQGDCRDLHSECADFLVQGITPVALRDACRNALVRDRRLNHGNPNPSNLASDFNRFDLSFRLWDAVRTLDPTSQRWKNRLDELNLWRNAIAHHDFASSGLGASILRLEQVRRWRSACDHLATSFDEVMRQHIQSITGMSPW